MSLNHTEREAILSRLIDAIGVQGDGFSISAFAKENGITTTSAYRYIDMLLQNGKLTKEKQGRKNCYRFVDTEQHNEYQLENLSEDIVWNRDIRPFLKDLPPVALANLTFAFTEMLNNAIDHSNGTHAVIRTIKNVFQVRILIYDDGVGIFNKITEALKLEEKSFAILELAKGKFTTDPSSHTGEGIFFSSKVVDEFAIFSDDLVFLGPTSETPPFLDKSAYHRSGTAVLLGIRNSHSQSAKEVFDQFSEDPDDFGFTKTIVPVRLLEYGDEEPLVVSRSQAKRLMVRFERFENIILDFSGISEIGQGFADELFRVFRNQLPNTKLTPINCSQSVLNMIRRVTE